jgi:TusA-related sulfurtransferase
MSEQYEIVGTVDAKGLTCPEPLRLMQEQLDKMEAGQIMKVIGDVGNKRSMERFLKMRRHPILSSVIDENDDKYFYMYAEKSANARTDIPISSCTLR